MSANFIKTWPCTDAARDVSVIPECLIAQLFGQSIDQQTVDELYAWVNEYTKPTHVIAHGKYEPDGIHKIALKDVERREKDFAITFDWCYSAGTSSTLRIKGLYLHQNLVKQICLRNSINHFCDYSAIYDGCAIEINCLATN